MLMLPIPDEPKRPSDAAACSLSSVTIPKAQLKDIVRCLEDGRMQWIMWAHSWQRDRAYGNGQPEIHPTHAGVIARFDKALTDLGFPPENDQTNPTR